MTSPLGQQQTNIGLLSPQLVDDKQPPIDSQKNFEIISNNMKRSESDQIRDKEHSNNLSSRDFNQFMNMNILSGDDSQNDQQDASKSKGSEPLSEDYQEQVNSDTEITTSMINANIFDSIDGIRNSKEFQFNMSFDSPNFLTSTQNAFPKKSGNKTSSMTNFGKSKSDFKKNIRKILKKNHKYYSNTQFEYDKDLAEYIPGLYRLLDLCKDDGSNGLGKFPLHLFKLKSES